MSSERRARRHRRVRVGLAAVVLASAGTGLIGMAGSATAQSGCVSYAAVAAAEGVRTVAASPGFSPTDADAQGPAAQAQADAVAGSNAFAGAPYSEAGAGNAGAGGADATQVPTFAISSHPSRPEDVKSSAALTLEARSKELASTAKAVGGPPSSDDASFGRASATAASSCAEDGVVKAVADSVDEVSSIAGVLTLGSVRSHAEAVVSASGELTMKATLTVDGATVLGQGVQITDKGLVAGGAPTALPANPLAKALTDAGVTVRYLAAETDPKRGQALAPGLEIVVASSSAPGGTSTTYTFGRSYARASATSEGIEPDSGITPDVIGSDDTGAVGGTGDVAATVAAGDQVAPSVGRSTATGSSPSPRPAPGSGNSREGSALRPTQPIATTSLESVYPALVVGAVVMAAAWFVFESLGVRLRWR